MKLWPWAQLIPRLKWNGRCPQCDFPLLQIQEEVSSPVDFDTWTVTRHKFTLHMCIRCRKQFTLMEKIYEEKDLAHFQRKPPLRVDEYIEKMERHLETLEWILNQVDYFFEWEDEARYVEKENKEILDRFKEFKTVLKRRGQMESSKNLPAKIQKNALARRFK